MAKTRLPGISSASIPNMPASVPGAPRFLPGGPSRNLPNFLSTVPYQPTSGEYRDIHTRQIRDFSGRFAGPTGIAWQGLDIVSANMTRLAQTTVNNTRKGMEDLANEMEAYAQANAPWEDRTTDARQGLKASVVHSPDRTVIWLGHTPYYGIWLETRWGGKFAILLPTLRVFGPRVQGKMVPGI